MLRHCLLLFGLIAATSLSAGGCRSCSSCHDYGPPVANSHCQACGTCRCGSASDGYVEGGYSVEDSYEPQEGYYESEGELPNPQSFERPRSTGAPARDQPADVR